jgi:hypothetical protein
MPSCPRAAVLPLLVSLMIGGLRPLPAPIFGAFPGLEKAAEESQYVTLAECQGYWRWTCRLERRSEDDLMLTSLPGAYVFMGSDSLTEETSWFGDVRMSPMWDEHQLRSLATLKGDLPTSFTAVLRTEINPPTRCRGGGSDGGGGSMSPYTAGTRFIVFAADNAPYSPDSNPLGLAPPARVFGRNFESSVIPICTNVSEEKIAEIAASDATAADKIRALLTASSDDCTHGSNYAAVLERMKPRPSPRWETEGVVGLCPNCGKVHAGVLNPVPTPGMADPPASEIEFTPATDGSADAPPPATP